MESGDVQLHGLRVAGCVERLPPRQQWSAVFAGEHVGVCDAADGPAVGAQEQCAAAGAITAAVRRVVQLELQSRTDAAAEPVYAAGEWDVHAAECVEQFRLFEWLVQISR